MWANNINSVGKDEHMNQDKFEGSQSGQESKKPWEEPKLDFVEPKLTKHGDLKSLTGFFGPFSPGVEE
jgi:hypothetical protein